MKRQLRLPARFMLAGALAFALSLWTDVRCVPGVGSPRAAADDAPAGPLEFRRVHLPSDRLSEVPLGTGRYVPMSAREFEEAVARLAPAASRGRGLAPLIQSTADIARYDVTCGRDGGLRGTVSFDIGADGGDRPGSRDFPLGDLDVRVGTVRTSAGTGEAVIFGRHDGSLAVATPEPGTYTCTFQRSPEADGDDGQRRLTLPLVPALSSTVVLRLPRDLRPVFVGGGQAVLAESNEPPAAADVESPDATSSWRIETGPRGRLDLVLVPHQATEQRLTTWTDVAIRGREVRLTVSLRPRLAWLSSAVRLQKHVDSRVTRVTIGDGIAGGPGDDVVWRVVDEGSTIVVDVPARFMGSLEPLVVSAVAPLGLRDGQLPLVRSEEDAWVGGGIAVRIAAAQSLASLALEHCIVVPPEAASRWPVPTAHEPPDGLATASGEDGVLPATFFLEEQSPRAVVMLSLAPRTAAVDVARVTTVELSPGLVVGRAACDVRVVRGEAFGLTARIEPGWFIDSVEAAPQSVAGEFVDSSRRRESADQGLEWRVQRDARGDVLRIGLTSAATPARGLTLRVAGHRGGLALGQDFPTSTLDMVRFEGEAERSTLVEFRTSPDTTVEIDGDEQAIPAVEGRLAALAEEGPVRGRMRGGRRVGARTARLVRRRPPLDVRTQVRITMRDDRLTESFTFECQPGASDLDSTVVYFSESMDVPLEWSLLPPAVGKISARRIDTGEGRPGQATAERGERWLVEVTPAVRGAVTIRAARTVPFMQAAAVPLARVDGATTTVGQVIVRDVGRSRPRIVNRRLTEIPPEIAAAHADAATVAEFSYDFDAAVDGGDEPAAELIPNPDARAWAWRELTSSWSFASGATEYETRFDIENHGRASLSLSLPPARKLESIVLDGVRQALGERPAAGGDVRIELPSGRRFVSLLVRTVAGANAVADGPHILRDRWWSTIGTLGGDGPAAWSVQPASVGVDVTVLQREWRLHLPPDIVVAAVRGGVRIVGDQLPRRDWAARLLGARLRPTGQADGAPPVTPAATPGFRSVLLVPAGGAGPGAAVLVVRERVLATITVVAAVVAVCTVLVAARFGSWPVLLPCLLAGVAALWCAPPVDGIARAAWWGAAAAAISSLAARPVGVGVAASRTVQGPAASVGLSLVAWLVAAAATAGAEPPDTPGRGAMVDRAGQATAEGVGQTDPLKVFITHPDGGRGAGREGDSMALVPEPLFQLLVRGEDLGANAPVRVLGVSIVAPATPEADGTWAAWRLALDVDADGGGMLVLDQSSTGAKFVAASASIDGVHTAGPVDAAAGVLRIPLVESGRHAIEVDVEPAVARRGETETVMIAIPTSPRGTLQLRGMIETTERGGVICEQMTNEAAFAAAPPVGQDGDAAFDVSRATQVRLVRSLVAGVGLIAQPKAVASRNDIVWSLDECRLNAAFDVEPGEGIVRAIEVVADASLELVESAIGATSAAETFDKVLVRQLDGHRFLVERRSPDRGRWRFELAFRRQLDDPVGAFEVPGAWLERADVDVRTVRFSVNSSLAVRIDLPAGVTAVPFPEGEAPFESRAWRGEVVHPQRRGPAPRGTAAVAPGVQPRLWVERRRQDVRGSQRLAVVFAADAVRLHLDSRIDASATALLRVPLDLPAGCEIDRIELFEDDALHPDTAERGPIDVRWTRGSASGADVVVQRPRAGRFRLEVDARIPGPPAARGAVPILQAALAAGSTTLVDWRVEDGRRVRLLRAADDGGTTAEDSRPRADGQIKLAEVGATPGYVLEPAASDPRRVDQGGEASAVQSRGSGSAEPTGAGRVELADIRLTIDERGMVWGLARFEVLAVERVVRLRLPLAWRLFDVSVDGRPAEGITPLVPEDDNVWEFQLLDPGWPRSVVALFTGDVGRRLVDGEPFALPAPQLVGLPCRNVIWTVHVPEWIALRVQEPARIVDAIGHQIERRAALGRLEPDFERAIGGLSGLEQERMREFFAARREGLRPDADEAWLRASSAPVDRGAASAAVTIVGDVDRLTIRAVRRPDPTTRGRGIATLSLLACGGLAWLASSRGRPSWLPTTRSLGPWLAMIAGMLWIALLTPTWPGAALVAVGWASMAAGWWPHRLGGDDGQQTAVRGTKAAAGRAVQDPRAESTTGFVPARGAD